MLSPFKFSSCWLYSAYPLLMVLLLALSTFSCVHYFLSLSKYISPLPITPFTHPCFFCCPISFCSVSTVSSKKHFYVTGTRPWLLITMKLSTIFEIYSDYFYLLLLPDFSIASLCRFTTNARVLSRRFLLIYVFYLSLLPHILEFLWLR